MRPGGGKSKGAAWEITVGRQLSLWISNGARADIFARNVQSGGVFTSAGKRGSTERGVPGDLMPADPLAFPFTQRLFVECKHLANLGLEPFLYNKSARGLLWDILRLANKQADEANLGFMLIAKQNLRPPIVIMRSVDGQLLQEAQRKVGRLSWHAFHEDAFRSYSLEEVTSFTLAANFLANITAERPYNAATHSGLAPNR